MTGSLPAWAVSIIRWTVISAALGLMFAWLGVYETGEIPLPERIAYWSVLMLIGAMTSLVVTPLVFEKWLVKFHPAVPIIVVSAIISLPITAGLVVIDALGDGTVASPPWWAQQYLYVLVISAILTTGAWAVDRFQDQKKATADASLAATASPQAAPSGSAFAARLPVKFRAAQVYAVSAEDHYLRVHTSAGETMLLMRLADAVRELAALEGQQTHRSWWVARQGLADVARGDGKVTLKLKSGAEAPVSRTYQKAVKDAGWL